jgi:hypothetical protein
MVSGVFHILHAMRCVLSKKQAEGIVQQSVINLGLILLITA